MSENKFNSSGRRVITGHDASGRSVLIDDSPTDSRLEVPGVVSLIDFWRMSSIPTAMSANDAATGQPRLSPPPGGLIARLCEIKPAKGRDPGGVEIAFERMGGSDAHRPDDESVPGMHETETVDIIYVASGEVYAVMEQGRTLLKAGDVLIQRGTNHAWVNETDEPAWLFAVLVDGMRATGCSPSAS